MTGRLDVNGNLAVRNNKFTIDATSGNVSATGTMDITGATRLASTLDVSGNTNINGNLSVNTNKFTVVQSTGNTSIGGTLTTTGATTINNDLTVTGTTVLNGSVINIGTTGSNS
jgi:hypothetical protein